MGLAARMNRDIASGMCLRVFRNAGRTAAARAGAVSSIYPVYIMYPPVPVVTVAAQARGDWYGRRCRRRGRGQHHQHARSLVPQLRAPEPYIQPEGDITKAAT